MKKDDAEKNNKLEDLVKKLEKSTNALNLAQENEKKLQGSK